MQSFFTFLDRALKYDCPSCGSFCCKGKGAALLAPFPAHLRSMALSALAFGNAELVVE